MRCIAAKPEASRRILPDLSISLALCAFGAVLCFLFYGRVVLGGIDDAAIVHVYARNIARGLGFVFNPGGEHVEGSTSLIWTLINAVVYALFGNFVPAMHVVSFVLCVATIFVWLRSIAIIADALDLRVARVEVVFSAIMLGSLPFYLWMIWSLMDVTIWTFIIALIFFCCLNILLADSRSRASYFGLICLCCVAIVTRPEGIAFALGAIAVVALDRWAAEKRMWPAIKFAALPTGLSIATMTMLVGWRMYYFGFPFPNTYYAKVSDNVVANVAFGLKYVFRGIVFEDTLLLGLIATAALPLLLLAQEGADEGALRNRAHSLMRAGSFPLLVTGFLVVVVLTGGDFFSLYRFLVPLVPALVGALAVLGCYVYEIVRKSARPLHFRGAAAVAAVALIGFFAIKPISEFQYNINMPGNALPNSFRTPPSLYDQFALRNRNYLMGEYLSRKVASKKRDASIGVLAAGGIALSYTGYIYDLLGLNWVEMAHANRTKDGQRSHASFDAETFFRHPPDLLVVLFPVDSFEEAMTKGVTHTDRFKAMYVPVVVETPEEGKITLCVRRDDTSWLGSDFGQYLDWQRMSLADLSPAK